MEVIVQHKMTHNPFTRGLRWDGHESDIWQNRTYNESEILHSPKFYLCKGHGFDLSADTSAHTRLGNKLKTPLNERAVFYSSTSMSNTVVKNPLLKIWHITKSPL
jgi:hypothetical protein